MQIDFNKYIDKPIVLVTNFCTNRDEVLTKIEPPHGLYRFKQQWIVARPLTVQDVEDEDFNTWLHNMWGKNELSIKAFIRYSKLVKPK